MHTKRMTLSLAERVRLEKEEITAEMGDELIWLISLIFANYL
jgi:hypothetical protein